VAGLCFSTTVNNELEKVMTDEQSFTDQIKAQLEDLRYQLDRLQHRIEDMADDAKVKAEAMLDDLETKGKELEKRLDELEDVAEDALEDVKNGLEIAWDGLKTGFYAAKSEFEEFAKK
jgi:chromosome segregation ATPase